MLIKERKQNNSKE